MFFEAVNQKELDNINIKYAEETKQKELEINLELKKLIRNTTSSTTSSTTNSTTNSIRCNN